ncbi:MAG: DUF1330 domain-containing protein, partial [Desulfatirhabdiaceae bacterium]|nr:DUF1330 domain-containing protein [Desulfatirhabdiaceae bacterium]
WVEITIPDRTKLAEYMREAPKIIHKYNGKYLVRGGALSVLEGTIGEHPTKILIEFPDKDSAVAWYESPEYRDIHHIRTDNSICNFMLLAGV